MNCDYTVTTNLKSTYLNPLHHYKTKHIKVDKHFFKEKLGSVLICTHSRPACR